METCSKSILSMCLQFFLWLRLLSDLYKWWHHDHILLPHWRCDSQLGSPVAKLLEATAASPHMGCSWTTAGYSEQTGSVVTGAGSASIYMHTAVDTGCMVIRGQGLFDANISSVLTNVVCKFSPSMERDVINDVSSYKKRMGSKSYFLL